MDDYKELVARLHGHTEEVLNVWELRHQAAEALDSQDRKIEWLSAELGKISDWYNTALDRGAELLTKTQSLEAELDALKSASAEPVAWLKTWNGGKSLSFYKDSEDHVPLYLHTPAAVQEITDEMAEAAMDEFERLYNPSSRGRCEDEDRMKDAIKVALAAAPKPPVQEDAKDACNHQWVRDEEAVLHHCCQKCGAVKKESNHAKP